MGRYDLFVAELKCPKCGTESKADDSTRMQTKGQKVPDQRLLPVGAAYPIDHDELFAASYLPLHPPKDGIVKLLQRWSCPSCGHRSNWAEVTIDQEVIRSIRAVEATPEFVETLHYVDDWYLDELDPERSPAEDNLYERLRAIRSTYRG